MGSVRTAWNSTGTVVAANDGNEFVPAQSPITPT